MLRRQLPAWSPITLGALGAGFRAALSGADAREALAAQIRGVYGSSEVILTDSGTSALALAIRAAAGKVKPPRAALPAYGCFDLMTAADAVGAEVVLYDLDPATLSPDPDSLRAALRHGPHSVVVAHWWGLPVDGEVIRGSVHSAGAVLIEDAAQGVGASVGGRPVGSLGELAILSFGRGKGRTGGRGGALLVNDGRLAPALLREVQQLGRQGRGLGELVVLAGLWALGRPRLFWLPAVIPGLRLGETIYRPPGPIGAISASATAVVSRIWESADQEAELRATNAKRWMGLIRERPDVDAIEVLPLARPGWLRFPIRARGRVREVLCSREAQNRGVMPGYPKTLADLGRPVLDSARPIPGAQSLVDECFTLPTHSQVAEVDFEAIRASMR